MTAIALPDDWCASIDGLVDELLTTGDRREPPIDPLELAAGLQVEVALDASQSNRGRFLRLPGRPAIFLRPEERPERIYWAAAHELGEMLAGRIAEAIGRPADEMTPDLREELANRFAGRLLLPERSFSRDALAFDGDLPRLKHRYQTASHELIAWRLLDLDVPTVVTVFDHNQLTRRRSNVAGGTPPLQAIERRGQGDAHLLGLPVNLTHGLLRVQAWPIHEPGWKREIVRTTLTSDD